MSSSCMARNCSIYNQSNTYIPLYYAYAAYCVDTLINEWSCKWCTKASNSFTIENVISTDYLQAFIGFDNIENQIVLSFRGTHNYEDWFKDLEYKQISYPNIDNAYVHQGFYYAYNEIRDHGLITSIQKLLYKYPNCTNILITGHSLGGALAELCALDLIENQIINNTKLIIYTFGCPRWANKDLALYFDNLPHISTNWRIVNKNDPVAIVPGKFLGVHGFYHTETEILYIDYWNDNFKYIECEGGEDSLCGYSLWTEEKNAHLWYMNIHEDCGINNYGERPYQNGASEPIGSGQQTDGQSDSNEYGSNFRVTNTHWPFDLSCIFIGLIVAIFYYIIVRLCQKRNGYKNIVEIENEEEKRKLRKKNRNKVKNIMKHGLLDNQGFGNANTSVN
eukprot:16563_1